MIRRLFTAASVLSLLLCISSAVLWVRGRGHGEGWRFRPSEPFEVTAPDPSVPSKWRAQWQVFWGDDRSGAECCLSVQRMVLPVDRPGVWSQGLESYRLRSHRWNPLPVVPPLTDASLMAREDDPRTFRTIRRFVRRKSSTALSFLGVQYIGHELEFGRFSDGSYFYAGGEHTLRLPLLYLFVLFAVLPAVWSRGAWRRFSRPRLAVCAACGYDLRASTDRCPECGTPICAEANV